MARKRHYIMIIAFVLGVMSVVSLSACYRRGGGPKIDPKAYYSVLLTNNTTFFGHIKAVGRRGLVMSDVYYLRRTPLLDDATKFNLTLVARRTEAHGPADELVLNRRSVFMYEKLRDDSKILELIKLAQSAPATGVPAPAAVAPTPGAAVPAPAPVAPPPVPAPAGQ